MTEVRCSNSCVRLADGQELYCENTIEDIENQLSLTGVAVLDLSDTHTELSVAEDFIVSYYASD